ncbi:MAG: DUF2182 domain-containing protein [Thaumarchaeota archaeon]|nr:DUF2182 domain-containing protein [Nitrososphaerota archaeon]
MSSGGPPSTGGSSSIFRRDKLGLAISAVLLSTAGVSWVAVYTLMPLMSSSSDMMGVASMVSSLSLTSVGVFELVWVVGMAAMMFPAMIPIMLFYEKVATNAEPNPSLARTVGTPLFLLGYLSMYAVLGLLAYLAVFAAVSALPSIPLIASIAFLGPTLVLALAGLYQLSPLKIKALMYCISPLGFFAAHSKKGLFGSFQMGVSNGTYCVGCCWAYMLVMLAIAVMSLPFMIIIAGLIVIEKVIARGAVWFNRVVAASFLLVAAAVLFFPNLLSML